MQWHHSFTLYDIELSAAGGVRASISRLKKVMSEARGIYNSACKGTTVSACLCTLVAQVIKFNMIILIRKHHPSELCKQKPPRLSFGSWLLGTQVTSGCAIGSSHPLPTHTHSLEGQQVRQGGAPWWSDWYVVRDSWKIDICIAHEYIHLLSSDMRAVWGEWQCIRIHNRTLYCISTVEIEKYTYCIWVAYYSDKHWIWLFWSTDIIRVSCANRNPHDSPLGVVYLAQRSHQVVQSVPLTHSPPTHILWRVNRSGRGVQTEAF